MLLILEIYKLLKLLWQHLQTQQEEFGWVVMMVQMQMQQQIM